MNNPIVNLLKATWHYSEGQRHRLVIFMCLSCIAQLIGLCEPLVIGQVFNSIQTYLEANSGNMGSDFSQVFNVIFWNMMLWVGIQFSFWVFHGPARVLESDNAFLCRKNLKVGLMAKIVELPISWHTDNHSGDTIDKIVRAGENLRGFAERMFLLQSNLINVVGSVIMLALIDIYTALLVVLTSFVALGVLIGIDQKLIAGYDEVNNCENYLATAIHDFIGIIRTVITLRLKKKVLAEVTYRAMRGFAINHRNNVLNEWKWFVMSMLVSLMTTIGIVLHSYLSLQQTGVILFGNLFMLYRYLKKVGDTYYNFAWTLGDIVRQDTALCAVNPLVKAHEQLDPQPTVSLPQGWQMLAVKSLNFSHTNGERKHLNSVSLEIGHGQKIAFIGDSGSGKTTMLEVLRGLFEPESVQLYCDGILLPHGLWHLHQATSLGLQKPELIRSTLEDNLTMDLPVTADQLEKAIGLALFSEKVAELPQGLKTLIGERGVTFSGGENQRSSLIRFFLHAQESDILLLDEPTSSVSDTMAHQIIKNIMTVFKDKTVIISVHQMGLLAYFDYVYQFKRGKIVSEGTPQQFITL